MKAWAAMLSRGGGLRFLLGNNISRKNPIQHKIRIINSLLKQA
jgi:hypothetical protein